MRKLQTTFRYEFGHQSSTDTCMLPAPLCAKLPVYPAARREDVIHGGDLKGLRAQQAAGRVRVDRTEGVQLVQVGNAFLAGDAAHRFPPAGGFGMNTGIQDAHNLAWKLAAGAGQSQSVLKPSERMHHAQTLRAAEYRDMPASAVWFNSSSALVLSEDIPKCMLWKSCVMPCMCSAAGQGASRTAGQL